MARTRGQHPSLPRLDHTGGGVRAHPIQETEMSDFKPGLEGVVAFETEIAEPDREGGSLRYRGVDIEDLIGQVSFGNVWALLVDGRFGPGLPPAEPFPVPVHSGDIRVDVQSAVAMLAPYWGLQQLLDIVDEQAREDLARVSVTALSFVAQSARGLGLPAVPQKEIDKASTIVERFMRRWRGEPDPRHVKAVDAYFISAAEHGMNASTFTARVVASTGPTWPPRCRPRWELCRDRCTAGRPRASCGCSMRSRPWATPSAGSGPHWTGATG